jgi:hypothetical protein
MQFSSITFNPSDQAKAKPMQTQGQIIDERQKWASKFQPLISFDQTESSADLPNTKEGIEVLRKRIEEASREGRETYELRCALFKAIQKQQIQAPLVLTAALTGSASSSKKRKNPTPTPIEKTITPAIKIDYPAPVIEEISTVQKQQVSPAKKPRKDAKPVTKVEPFKFATDKRPEERAAKRKAATRHLQTAPIQAQRQVSAVVEQPNTPSLPSIAQAAAPLTPNAVIGVQSAPAKLQRVESSGDLQLDNNPVIQQLKVKFQAISDKNPFDVVKEKLTITEPICKEKIAQLKSVLEKPQFELHKLRIINDLNTLYKFINQILLNDKQSSFDISDFGSYNFPSISSILNPANPFIIRK